MCITFWWSFYILHVTMVKVLWRKIRKIINVWGGWMLWRIALLYLPCGELFFSVLRRCTGVITIIIILFFLDTDLSKIFATFTQTFTGTCTHWRRVYVAKSCLAVSLFSIASFRRLKFRNRRFDEDFSVGYNIIRMRAGIPRRVTARRVRCTNGIFRWENGGEKKRTQGKLCDGITDMVGRGWEVDEPRGWLLLALAHLKLKSCASRRKFVGPEIYKASGPSVRFPNVFPLKTTATVCVYGFRKRQTNRRQTD